MELQRYLTIIRRWIWLLVLGVVLGASGGYFASSSQTPIYQASTRFVILRAAQTSNADYYSYLDSQQLISTYIQLLTTTSLAEAASKELGFQVYPGQASASQITDTQFVQLTVTNTDPEKAAKIANVMVTTLIDQNEQLQAIRYVNAEQNLQNQADNVQAQIATLQTQITDISSATVQDQVTQVQTQIDDLQTQITGLQTRINELTSLSNPTDEQKIELVDKQANLAQLQPVLALYQQVYTNLVVLGQPVDGGNSSSSTQLSQLQTTLGLYQQIYVSLLSSLENVRLARAQNTPNVVQVEVATVPMSPIRPQPFQSTLLAAAVGFMLAAGIAFLVEYLDDTLKTPEDIERVLNLTVLGLVADMGAGQKKNGESPPLKLHVAENPRSPVSEAFRSLRTNLEFSGVDRPLHILMVTSSGPGEGKSTIASNMAFILAQSGKRVILVDGDLRRPNVHRMLDIPNRIGLSDVLRGKRTIAEVLHPWNGSTQMSVITSGSLPPNPSELLGSEKMGNILAELSTMAEMVVIDTPPMLVADAQILSSRVDGIIFVVQPGKTHTDSARTTVEQLVRVQARLLGVVLNRIPRNRAYYYGGYRHYSPYYYYSNKHRYSAYGAGSESREEAESGKEASNPASPSNPGQTPNKE
jgi:succinoglycan biosynthesis transport protein ExoP